MPIKRTVYGIPRKKGRPKSKNPRDSHVHVRLNDDEVEKLVKIMDLRDFSTTEAIRFAINLTYDLIK